MNCNAARLVGPIAILGCLLSAGCADTKSSSRPDSISQRQDHALRDPFGYGPSAETWETKNSHPSVTGGGTSELDKAALKRDIDLILNP